LLTSPHICQFLREELLFLGYKISQEGLSPNPEKVRAIAEFPTPGSALQVRQFLGLAGYYRKFISQFSSIAEPLIALTRDGIEFKWDESCQRALEELKVRLTSSPILLFPDFAKPFFLHTDACNAGLGAALMQHDSSGREIAVAFASRTLHKAERKYSTSEKECLAVVWALEYFRPYVEGSLVTVYSDHSRVYIVPCCPLIKAHSTGCVFV
uniref:Reverse transcriptase/retrotransposon-derived protein RNase H-like domain-containing protein n=1 Tax=Paramormyrops kingsleyae TaxID=1676925 RepID=A0A3B3R7C8_9TELE